jgi:cytochrome c oxidase subunit 4
MLFFMHLLFERAWKYVLLAPTIILAIGIPLALLPDIGLHYYTEDVPQMRIPNPEPGGHGGGHGNHAEGESEAKAEAPAPEDRATKE